MEVSSFLETARTEVSKQRSREIQKQEAAQDFEEIFARKLVQEMTKDSFKMGDNNSPMGSSNNLYRKYITDTLAGEIAAQRKLGMAESDMARKILENAQDRIEDKFTAEKNHEIREELDLWLGMVHH